VKLLSFDIEISDVFELRKYEDMDKYAPFHISVAATVIHNGDERIWYSEEEGRGFAPRILPTIGHPLAVALHFVRCGQLTGGLAPSRSRPCWAHPKKGPHLRGLFHLCELGQKITSRANRRPHSLCRPDLLPRRTLGNHHLPRSPPEKAGSHGVYETFPATHTERPAFPVDQ